MSDTVRLAGGGATRGDRGDTNAATASADPIRLAGRRVLRTFEGVEPTEEILGAIRAGLASGVTIFRAKNVGSPGQLRGTCERLQAARPEGDPPLVIGLDQEGGQLQAVGHGATAWPGQLALGATGSAELARAAGAAIGAEAAAMGATLVYAPVCDVLQPSSATPLGTRSFGSDPALVASLAAAMTEGLQAAGVAASLKHFPGHGAAAADSHVSMPVITDDAETIRARDLAPFRAGIRAGAMTVLAGHIAVPAMTAGRPVAATVSPVLLGDLLRGELGFDGVTVSDAMDMGGAGGPDRLEATVVAAADAGLDLLLLVHGPDVEDTLVAALARAIAEARVDRRRALAADERVLALRRRLRLARPPLEVVGCPEHRALARRIAEASLTLVRDPRSVLPLRLPTSGRVAFLAPVPIDLTPAETSSYVRLELAEALRERGLLLDELVVPLDPSPAEVAALLHAAGDGPVIVATFDAVSHPGQVGLAEALSRRGPVIAVALRSPYDAVVLPREVAVACSYGIQPPQMAALADALLGRIPFAGRLPVTLTSSREGVA